jgi:PBP1b-binding outer membrane lipoprotein LpoB
MVKLFLSLSLLAIFVGCSTTEHVSKSVVRKAKLPDLKKKYKTFQIARLDINGSSTGRLRGINSIGFKNVLENAVINTKAFKVIHMNNLGEDLVKKTINTNHKVFRGELLLYGNYVGNSSIEHYSNDAVGRQSKVVVSRGQFDFKLVDGKTGEILYTDNFFQRRSSGSIMDPSEAVPTGISIESGIQEQFARDFTALLVDTKGYDVFSMQKGKDDKYIKVVSLVRNQKYRRAYNLQKSLLKKQVDDRDISDGHFNLAMIHVIEGNKQRVKEHIDYVKNGFIKKDRDYLERYLR